MNVPKLKSLDDQPPRKSALLHLAFLSEVASMIDSAGQRSGIQNIRDSQRYKNFHCNIFPSTIIPGNKGDILQMKPILQSVCVFKIYLCNHAFLVFIVFIIINLYGLFTFSIRYYLPFDLKHSHRKPHEVFGSSHLFTFYCLDVKYMHASMQINA